MYALVQTGLTGRRVNWVNSPAVLKQSRLSQTKGVSAAEHQLSNYSGKPISQQDFNDVQRCPCNSRRSRSLGHDYNNST